VVGRQPNAPAAFSPGEILGTHFQRVSRPQGTWRTSLYFTYIFFTMTDIKACQ